MNVKRHNNSISMKKDGCQKIVKLEQKTNALQMRKFKVLI